MESTPIALFSLRKHTAALTVCPNRVFFRSAAPAASREKTNTQVYSCGTATWLQYTQLEHSLHKHASQPHRVISGLSCFRLLCYFYICIMIWISVVDPALVTKSSSDVTLWIVSGCCSVSRNLMQLHTSCSFLFANMEAENPWPLCVHVWVVLFVS